jgi:hypothetical protein
MTWGNTNLIATPGLHIPYTRQKDLTQVRTWCENILKWQKQHLLHMKETKILSYQDQSVMLHNPEVVHIP